MLNFTVEESDRYKPHFATIAAYVQQCSDRSIPTIAWSQINNATKEILCNVDSNYYTAWEVRATAVNNDEDALREEIEFCNEFRLEDEKTFSLWSHRMRIVSKLLNVLDTDDDRQELYTSELLWCQVQMYTGGLDAKNHCLWSYRTGLLVKYFKFCSLHPKFESGLDAFLLKEYDAIWAHIYTDMFNNSSWSFLSSIFRMQRFRLITTSQQEKADETWFKEVLRVAECIAFRPNNASIWNFYYSLYASEDELDNTEPVLQLPTMSCKTIPMALFKELFTKSYNVDDVGIEHHHIERFHNCLVRHHLYDVVEAFALEGKL